jgi:hypothetical protein
MANTVERVNTTVVYSIQLALVSVSAYYTYSALSHDVLAYEYGISAHDVSAHDTLPLRIS